MTLTVRTVATSLAIGFSLYFAARAVWWIIQPTAPLLMIAAIALYLAAIMIGILAESARGARMPPWAAVFAVVASVSIPILVSASLEPIALTEPFATWYIGGVGLIGVVCIVRRRFVAGWACVLALTVLSSLYLGFFVSLELGLVGSIVWMVVAQLLVWFWDRAVRDTERLAGIQQAVSAWHATQQVRQRERRVRVQYALAVAGPVLSRTVAARGDLDEEERLAARLAEGRLRDELRGASLLNDAVRAAIEDVRRRGVTVTVFDEGGLDDVDEERRTAIRNELAEVLRTAEAGRVIIRAARDAHTAVTVVGRSGNSGSSDEDSVGLWHEILRRPPKE
ncbi:MAG: hypothetical protein ACQEW8_04645 [Actinomycetota bacterium]